MEDLNVPPPLIRASSHHHASVTIAAPAPTMRVTVTPEEYRKRKVALVTGEPLSLSQPFRVNTRLT